MSLYPFERWYGNSELVVVTGGGVSEFGDFAIAH